MAKTGELIADEGVDVEVAPYVSGKRGREVFLNGDVEYGVSFYLLLHPSILNDALFD